MTVSFISATTVTQVVSLILALVLGGLIISMRLETNTQIVSNADANQESVLHALAMSVHTYLDVLTSANNASLRSQAAAYAKDPSRAASFTTLTTSGFAGDWLDANLDLLQGYASGTNTTFRLDSTITWSGGGTTAFYAMERLQSATMAPVLNYYTRNASSAAGAASVYQVAVDTSGQLRGSYQGEVASVSECSGSCASSLDVSSILTSATHAAPALRLGGSYTPGSGPTIVSSMLLSTDSLVVDLNHHALNFESEIAEQVEVFVVLRSSTAEVLGASGPIAARDRSTCVASAATTAAKLACAVPVAATSHPEPRLLKAVALIPPMSVSTDGSISKVSEGSLRVVAMTVNHQGIEVVVYIDAIIIEGRVWTLILITVAVALLELVLAGFTFVQTRKQLREPINKLSQSMADIMHLEFDHIDADAELMQQYSLTELGEISEVTFDMAQAVQGFGRYVPKEVIRELQETHNLHSRVMTSKVLTFLFVDIANFTTMCESLNTDDLAELAEKYFSVTTRTCAIHGCTIDKFIGDAIMGFWGAPLDYTQQGYSSCCTALHLQSVVERLGTSFQEMGLTLSIRIGLHRGQALVGNIGCSDRISYTALGSAVTIGGRLEALNKQFSTLICISEAVLVDAERTAPGIFATRRLGTCLLEDGDNTPVFELVGVRAAEAKRFGKGKSAGESRKRKGSNNSRRAGRSPAGSSSSSHRKEAEKDASSSDGGDNVSSINIGTSVSLGSSRSGEKLALLTEEEEVQHVGKQFMLSEDTNAALQLLSSAVLAYEAMKFDEAVQVMQHVLVSQATLLEACGIKATALQKLLQTYEKMARTKPSQKNFGNGWIKLF